MVDDTFITHQPRNFPYNEDRHDDRYYGNITRNFQIFGSALGLYDPRPPSFDGENQCAHDTYSGELITQQVSVPLWKEDYDFYGFTAKVENLHGNIFQFCTVNSVHPLDVSPYSANYGGLVSHNVLDLLDQLIGEKITNFAVIGGHLTRRELSRVSYVINDTGLVVQYHCYAHDHITAYDYDWNSEIVVPFVEPDLVFDPVIGQSYATGYTSETHYRYSAAITDDIEHDMGPDHDRYDGGGSNAAFPIILSYPSGITDEIEAFSISVPKKLGEHKYLDNFAKAVHLSYRDITASSLFSSVDAFLQAQSSLDVNLLQDLAELPEILSSIPDLQAGLKVIGRLAKRDFSFATLREILNYVTSENLRYSFGAGPTIDSATKTIPKLISTFDRLGLSSKQTVGRGSYYVKLSNVLGRQEVTIQTRTKIVMDSSFSGLLSAITRVDCLGLLPKASNLWDILPFTFVVNWFTGIGSALRRAEYSAQLAVIPAYYVHTYTISSPLSDLELESIGASSSSSKPASLRLYYRDISLYSPIPRDSRFGFGYPSGIPSWGTFGSLLYQLIFGR
jgi:hypothetical protein